MQAVAEAKQARGAARRDPRDFHPFLRLARLLDPLAPGRSPLPDGRPINLAVGDPQTTAPPILAETVARHHDAWSSYPPFRGTEAYRRAAAAWLARRYALPSGFLDPERHILAVPGSREGLFFATLAAVTLGAREGRDKVLLPMPSYHVYAGSAVAAGAEPVFVPALQENGFLPDYGALPPEVLSKAAIAFLCSPSNPEGAALGREQWERAIALARRYGFVLVADECYAEIWLDQPPVGLLEAAAGLGGPSGRGLDGLLAVHSLSKRSSAAGLRCGFVAGDPRLVDDVDAVLRFGGAGVAVPVAAAGAALWSEESHVEANRAYYRELFELAERRLGNRFGFRRPAGAFFLWLEVGEGEEAARRLWQDGGIRVLPGAYLCGGQEEVDTPGRRFIRVALVHPPAVTDLALARLAELL